ncbi:MAG: serine hydrolase domain-containing protein [Bacteroidota bacterium]
MKCVSLFAPLLLAQGFVHAQAEEVGTLMAQRTSAEEPGGVVAVIHNQEVVYKKAFGLANVKNKRPIEINTPFGMASISKQFTAMCIALLEEQAELSIDNDIRTYYPEFQFEEPIKVRNLIDHTSGIREAYVLMQLAGRTNLLGKVPEKFQTKDQLIGAIGREKDLNFPTGSEFAYTNINYILLGDIVEKVSGQQLSEFADSAIFKPLEMYSTFFNDEERRQKFNGYYYNGKKYKARSFVGGVVGDHNLVSTIDDMIKWSNNRYDNQLGNKDPKLYDQLFTSSKLDNGQPTEYGYGVFVSSYRGLQQIDHGGDNDVHTSFMRIIPDLKLTVISMSYSSRYDQVLENTREIVDLYLDRRTEAETEANFQYISVDQEMLASRSGLYYTVTEKGLGHIRKLTYENGGLFASDSYTHKGLKLHAISEQYFVAKNSSNKFLHIHFSTDSEGNMTLHEEYEDLVDLRFTKHKKVVYEASDFLGEYKNESTGAVIKVKAGKEGLKAKKGIIKLPMIALQEDLFYASNVNALFRFQRNESGEVVKLTVDAYDFRNFKLDRVE